MHHYRDANELLIKRFSAIESIYAENIEDYEGLPYVFYETELIKYVMEKIGSSDIETLKEIFGYVEEMLLDGDEEFKNLIEVAVIESLFHEDDFENFKDLLLPLCGQLTLKSFNDCLI